MECCYVATRDVAGVTIIDYVGLTGIDKPTDNDSHEHLKYITNLQL